jgi:adenine-specific DNA methylase
MTAKKKLIEVALPLDAINKASVRESYIYRGNPSSLHKWWAQRPLAAARAVIFAQMVDDPSAHPDRFPTEETQERERQRLFRLIEELVQWENTTNEIVLTQARDESGRAGAPPALRIEITRARKSCSTQIRCRCSTIPSQAVGRCRWKRSGWGWKVPLPT